MAKDVKALIRLHQWIVDEKRRALGQLLGDANSLEKQAADLETEILVEQEVVKGHLEELGFGYGAYAKAAIDRRGRLADSRVEVEEKIVLAQDEVRKEYRDLKTYEISQEARDKREEGEKERRAQAFLDEVGLQSSHRRRQAE